MGVRVPPSAPCKYKWSMNIWLASFLKEFGLGQQIFVSVKNSEPFDYLPDLTKDFSLLREDNYAIISEHFYHIPAKKVL